MKSIFYILLFIIFTSYSIQAQKKRQFEESFSFECATDIIIYHFDFLKDSVETTNKIVAEYGKRFYRIGQVKKDSTLGQFYVIKSSEIDQLNKGYKYYAMKLEEFENQNVIRRYSKWDPLFSVGTLIIPIKLRPATKNSISGRQVEFDYTQDFTLGTTFGFKMRASNYNDSFVNILFGVGITSVLVDSLTTNGIIEDSNVKVSAFTPSFGVLFEFNSFQIGAFLGKDYVGNTINRNWDYQGKTWIAVGLGYQILSRSANRQESKK